MAAAIASEFNTHAFDCRVGTTPQMYNKVANPNNMGIFSKPVESELEVATMQSLI